MKRRHFFKTLGLAAPLPWLGNFVRADSTRSQRKSHKVLSCNIRVDLPEDSESGNGWKHRHQLCADVIVKQKPDLIGLQEAQDVHLKYLKSRLPEFDNFGLSNSLTPFRPNNTILFLRERYELISGGGFWYSETPHVAGSKSWDSAHPRFVNWVHLRERESGQEFYHWNTHFDHKGHEARAKAGEMLAQASAVLPQNFPQILTGDMNAGATHPAIKNLQAGGWVDTYNALHGPDDPGFTFHGFKGKNHPAKRPDGRLNPKIDWIFSRGAVKPVSAAILRDSRDGRYPSDHYFIAAEVLLG